MLQIISFIVKVQEHDATIRDEPTIRTFFMKALPLDAQDGDKREPMKIADSIRKKIKVQWIVAFWVLLCSLPRFLLLYYSASFYLEVNLRLLTS
jgi:hypothetical protein